MPEVRVAILPITTSRLFIFALPENFSAPGSVPAETFSSASETAVTFGSSFFASANSTFALLIPILSAMILNGMPPLLSGFCASLFLPAFICSMMSSKLNRPLSSRVTYRKGSTSWMELITSFLLSRGMKSYLRTNSLAATKSLAPSVSFK